MFGCGDSLRFYIRRQVTGTWHNVFVTDRYAVLMLGSYYIYRNTILFIVTRTTIPCIYRRHWSSEPILPTVLGEIVVDQREG